MRWPPVDRNAKLRRDATGRPAPGVALFRMSVVPRSFPYDTGFAGAHMRADEFLGMGETTERYQLIEGPVMRTPRPTSRHQAVIHNVMLQFAPHLQRGLAVAYAEVDWQLDDDTVYSPDIAVYGASRSPGLPAALTTTPDLIIEVLSPGAGSFDLNETKDAYERAGLAEYWAIDPKDAGLRCSRRQEGLLVEIPFKGDTIVSAVLPGLTLHMEPLRELAAAD